MNRTIISALAVSLFALSAHAQEATIPAPVQKAQDSICKGLDASACGSTVGCQWMPERIANVTKAIDGTPHKRSAKAHCRKGTPKSTQDITAKPENGEAAQAAPQPK